eukprot:gene24595-33063_t
MIAANKRYLKANLTQGVLGIQTNLINLYSSNLSAIATQAALISGFSFTAVLIAPNYIDYEGIVLSYFYYACFTLCLVAALFVLTVSTVANVFGPTMALKGSTDDSVKMAANKMMSVQIQVLQVAAISISALFLGACLLSWSNYPPGIATICTVFYIVTYYFLILEGFKTYRAFIPDEDALMDLDPDETSGGFSNAYKKLLGATGGEAERVSKENAQAALAAKLASIQEQTRLKLKAPLWKRQSIEEGGLFFKYFAVLEKGRLDLYLKEKDYRENLNPINSKPIKLWQYDVELDPRKYAKNVTSVSSTMKSAMMGNEDFAMSDLLTSKDDLQLASRSFKFGLVPKVSSELTASVVHEFLAHDEKLYSQWTDTMGIVVSAYNEIAAMPSIEQTIRVGTSDVEMVVQAANNNSGI